MFVYLNNVSMEIYFILTLLGLVIGSFVSVVTYRLPRQQGFISGRSYCDSCKKEISWYDNIPLISFLLYRGATRCCNKKISFRYPLIEITSAASLVGLYLVFGLSMQLATYYLLLVLTLSILIIDLEHQIIPDEFVWLLLITSMFVLQGSPFTALVSGFAFACFFLFLYLVTFGRGMGLGDVKLAIPIGMMLGFDKGLYWLLITFILGGIVASMLLLFNRAGLKTKIAFGPFMIVAFWIVKLIVIN